jgi:fumarate reductase flavoprotein subunit
MTTTESEQLDWSKEADVVVVGGGGAGMAAAAGAAEADPDADVLVLQKLSELGGSTTMAMGSFTAAGTSVQDEMGIDDTPDAHFDDFDKFVDLYSAGESAYFYLDFEGDLFEKDNLALRRLLVDNAADTLDWLREKGAEYSGPYAEGHHAIPRVHQIKPNTKIYADIFEDELDDLGVEVMYETEAYELVESDGAVHGVLAEERGRTSPHLIGANRGVILATGDFINNEEMRARYTSDTDALAINDHNVGDGHRMAREVGADLVNMDVQWLLLRVGDPYYTGPEFPRMVPHGAILVNAEGSRFINETAQYDQVYKETLRQPNKELYIAFDERVADVFSEWPESISTWGRDGKPVAYVQEYEETDVLQTGETPAAAADAAGLDPEAFSESLERYNEGIYDEDTGQHIDPFGRREREALVDPPYYVMGPLRPYSVITDGGVAIDEQLRVLNGHEPIDGLYAAGVMAGDNHLFGHGHHQAWSFTSGRLAGQEVAARTETPPTQ